MVCQGEVRGDKDAGLGVEDDHHLGMRRVRRPNDLGRIHRGLSCKVCISFRATKNKQMNELFQFGMKGETYDKLDIFTKHKPQNSQ